MHVAVYVPATSARKSGVLGAKNTSQPMSFGIVVDNDAHRWPKKFFLVLTSLNYIC
jgi:hypothetical protein